MVIKFVYYDGESDSEEGGVGLACSGGEQNTGEANFLLKGSGANLPKSG